MKLINVPAASAAGVFYTASLILVILCAPAAAAAQEAARAREARATPAGEVAVVLNEQIFNALLDALLAMPRPPTFPLKRGASGGDCASEITLAREVSGARTLVRFERGRISAPVAFRGSYNAPVVGCLKFEGWADTQLNLAFDSSKQALAARVEVKKVNLSGVPSMFSDGVTGLVQDSLDERVNPVEILRAEQVSAQLPLRRLATGGTLRLRARDIRHEILPGELRLRIAYEFVRED
ncbi:MAG: hypothetical protein LC800_06015 [Acidobacteria bacterium]|nr:hypothetical protein [Acidobacteriota bacterium]